MKCLLAATILSVLGCGLANGEELPNLEIEFTVAVPKSKHYEFRSAVQSDARFPPCVDATDSLKPAYSHSPLYKHLRPSDPEELFESYSFLYFTCQKTGNANPSAQHYALFNEKALTFSIAMPEYPIRVLADTKMVPDHNCPRNYCAADGLLHHAPTGCPCKWSCGVC